MRRLGTIGLLLALASFLIFFANVALGAAHMGSFLGDVPEMLTLFACALFFVIGILAREAEAARKKQQGRTGT
jgi:membrane protein implicated in regulation of membrane protease activity